MSSGNAPEQKESELRTPTPPRTRRPGDAKPSGRTSEDMVRGMILQRTASRQAGPGCASRARIRNCSSAGHDARLVPATRWTSKPHLRQASQLEGDQTAFSNRRHARQRLRPVLGCTVAKTFADSVEEVGADRGHGVGWGEALATGEVVLPTTGPLLTPAFGWRSAYSAYPSYDHADGRHY